LKAIGDVLQFLDQREEALNRYQEALEYYRQIGDRLGEANILQEFGKLESNPQRSLEYLQKAHALYIQINDIYSQSRNLLFIAEAQLNLGEKDAAISSLTQASELAARINFQPFQEYAENKIAAIQNPLFNLWSFARRFFQQPWVIYGLLFLVGLIVVLLLR
uniref:tetratricopeptide repeat protein n=1 Tax=Mastigocoleus sp. MO_188.B34 TaxID=3036635 RepID=UPI002602F8AE